MKNVEQSDYKLVSKKGNIEIRDYSHLILAEVEVLRHNEVMIEVGIGP